MSLYFRKAKHYNIHGDDVQAPTAPHITENGRFVPAKIGTVNDRPVATPRATFRAPDPLPTFGESKMLEVLDGFYEDEYHALVDAIAARLSNGEKVTLERVKVDWSLLCLADDMARAGALGVHRRDLITMQAIEQARRRVRATGHE